VRRRGCTSDRERLAIPDDLSVQHDRPDQWPDEARSDADQFFVRGNHHAHLADQHRNRQSSVQTVETVEGRLICGVDSFAGVQKLGDCRCHGATPDPADP